jgi:twinkle protein
MSTETRNQPAPDVRTPGAINESLAFPSRSAGSGFDSTATIAAGTVENTTRVGNFALKALQSRGIDPETVARLSIYTGRSVAGEDGESHVVPDENGNIVVFPFIERGSIVAEKYRAAGKKFWQRKDGRRTFWNADVLDDPALDHYPLIITEGEIDAITAIDCGFPLTVSVPDGAPAVRDGEDPEELAEADPERERDGKFEFVWNNRDRIKRIKRFILAVDSDGPGRRLAAELKRRLSASRCMFVVYPEGCKDLNDVLMKHGRDAVTQCLNEARPYPVKGLYRLSDYPDTGEPRTYSTGWPELDDCLKPWLGELMVVTGIPGHGKSTWVMNLCVNLARAHGWVCAVASFEIPTVPALRFKLRLAVTGAGKERWHRQMIEEADGFIQDHFVFIDDDPTGGGDEDLTLEWLLDRAADAVLRDGIKVLVIDPWNEVEHARPKGESETQYVNRALRSIRRFALRYDVLAIVVVHPTKEVGKDGNSRVPTLYDCEGSAAWFNKPDHGVVIDVPNPVQNETVVWVKKARFSWSGRKGDVTLEYLPEVEGYRSMGGITPLWKITSNSDAA